MLLITLVFPPFNLLAAKTQNKKTPIKEKTEKKDTNKIYGIRFFSLKPGHSIGPATLVLHDKGILELKVERENLIAPKGTYTIANFTFEASWEFSIRKNKLYHYVSQFKGLYLADAYIIGIFMLKEYMEEKRLVQEIPFLFFAEIENKKDKKANPFF
ncbi:MAG: hypothetical protein NTZ51_06930 [Proteobacteria bacterium]|nr:hypothetical protein [Pseudomonadota bacterium]